MGDREDERILYRPSAVAWINLTIESERHDVP